LRGIEESFERRIVQGFVSHSVADFQSFESHGLRFPGNLNGISNALQWHAAESDEAIRMFLSDVLNRFVLFA
jgi:hypothetical protein